MSAGNYVLTALMRDAMSTGALMRPVVSLLTVTGVEYSGVLVELNTRAEVATLIPSSAILEEKPQKQHWVDTSKVCAVSSDGTAKVHRRWAGQKVDPFEAPLEA